MSKKLGSGKTASKRPTATGAGSSRRASTRTSSKKSQVSKAVSGGAAAGSSRPSTRGLGLSAKLSITIALVSVTITFISSFIIASQTQKFLNEEILKAGVDGVKLLASQGRMLIIDNYDGSEQTFSDFQRKLDKTIEGARVSELLDNTFKDLPTPIMDGYITIEEFTEQKVLSVQNSNSKTLEIKYGDKVAGYQAEDLQITHAVISKGGTNSTRVYVFEKDLNLDLSDKFMRDGFRPKGGKARLFLSTAKVDQSNREVMKTTAGILAGSVFLSILIAYLLSLSITKPIMRLVDDMTVVSKGDLSHKTEAHSSDEIGYLSTTFNQLTISLKHAHEAEIEKEKLEHDLSVGREIQQTLLPRTLYKIPGYDLDAFYMSAKEVGGDYYDLIPVDKSRLGVVVADVSGKGIQGAMIMTIMRTVMNIVAQRKFSSAECLSSTNRFLAQRIKRGMFVTAFYAILDCKKGTLNFSSAGHNPMVIYRAKTGEIELLNPTGIALGFDKGPLFERTLKEGEASLEPGDRFVLYTDGVVESMNEAHEEFTDERFYEFVKANAEVDSKTFIHKLVLEVKKHQGEAPQHDDITIVTFRKK
ncbi:MAG: SpoIIE family protein phosphatase [Planctomycetes bacterium]|nr:SpoIIE family protein phosphatase [Planctomycetota bacterium]